MTIVIMSWIKELLRAYVRTVAEKSNAAIVKSIIDRKVSEPCFSLLSTPTLYFREYAARLRKSMILCHSLSYVLR